MACAADVVGAAMEGPRRNNAMRGQAVQLRMIITITIDFRSGVPRSLLPYRDRRQPSCGEQARLYAAHYATLIEDEDHPKFWEGTFLTEQT